MRLRLPGVAVPTAAAVVVLALAGWFMSTTAGLRVQVLSCWLAVAVFASMMSYFAFRASTRMDRSDPRRRFWAALAAAAAVFGVGEWAQLVSAVVEPLSLAALTGTGVVRTIALAVGCILLTVVVLTYPIPHRSSRDRLCYLLDLATVVTAAGTFGLYWTVASTGADRSVTGGELAAVAAGPIVAMLTAFAVGRLHLSRVAPFNWQIGILGPFAAVVEAAARLLGPELVQAGRPGVVFTMTVSSHGLLMIAAWAQQRSPEHGRARPARTRKLPFSLLPYAALWTTFALVVVTLATRAFDVRVWIAVTGLAAITGFVVARQLTSFIDNADLLAQRDVLTARLHTMAFTDGLTGLANRAMFLERLDQALHDDAGPVGVLLIDLDDFKPVNDSFGHAAGDEVLVQTAARLRACAGPADVVARLGGDEFAVLVGHAGDLPAVAARIVEAAGDPCDLAGGQRVRVHASVGGTVASGPGLDTSALLHTADVAMYAAKCSGKGTFHLAEATGHHAEPAAPLRQALARR
ncbi:GGDEF domain-containing protein [Actinoplanes sp. NPDC024001]|uniref:GGDEF domain-containing protein n=1 Tax=Actinoplanes sp. NPDC024001 TaxID=3154598 RepID=UPI0033C367FA